MQEDLMGYGDVHGNARFRDALAGVIGTFIAKNTYSLNPDNITAGVGCGSLISNLSLLLCEPSR